MALYQKYRPMTFEDVIGQEHVTRTLTGLIRAGSVPHACLFYGPQGTGKTSAARIFARAINCESENRPCNQCPSCKAFLGNSLDLVELDAATNSGVDTVRETIRDSAHFLPSMAKYKVYIIDEVHGLSRQAFDALLKILEEPPKHLVFVLATTEFGRVPKTVVSRCQIHSFHRVPTEAIYGLLTTIASKEGIAYEEPGLHAIARFSNGCVRDAVSLLGQMSVYSVTLDRVQDILGLGAEGEVVEFLRGIESGPSEFLTSLDSMVERGIAPDQFINQVVDILNMLMRYKLGAPGIMSDTVSSYCRHSAISTKVAIDLISALLAAKQSLRLMDPFAVIASYVLQVVGTGVEPQPSVPEVARVETSPPDPMQDSIVKELLSKGFELVYSSFLEN